MKPHFSPAVAAGSLLFLSGALGFDRNGALATGIEAQTRQCLDNLAGVLARHGLGPADIVKTTVWLTDQADFVTFNSAYAAWFGDWAPARSTTIAGLAIDGALVEIEAVARLRQP
ncbi:RidA family protein [Niveispirillum sp. KHB5.9]|uniref:RidA family protein n=1 Tax=Niveispirillum sp. KHB5.9 TaxID=3400269 RepID=UPI003A896B92